MGDVPHHTVLHMLEYLDIFTDNSADQDCPMPLEVGIDCFGGEKGNQLDIFQLLLGGGVVL